MSTSASVISRNSNTVVLDFGAINAGSSKSRTIRFKINDTFSGVINNIAEISADSGNDIDSTTDSTSSNDVVSNNVINNANNDEDDHDEERITVQLGNTTSSSSSSSS